MSTQPMTSDRYRYLVSLALKYLLAVSLALIIIIPLVTAILGGFKSNADLQNNSFGLPQTFVWSNYADILTSPTFWQQLLNSTIVMVATAVGVVVLAAMPAFVFARVDFRGRELAFYDPQMRFVTEPGVFWFGVGASSADIRIAQTVTLTGEVAAYRQREIIATRVAVEHRRRDPDAAAGDHR